MGTSIAFAHENAVNKKNNIVYEEKNLFQQNIYYISILWRFI